MYNESNKTWSDCSFVWDKTEHENWTQLNFKSVAKHARSTIISHFPKEPGLHILLKILLIAAISHSFLCKPNELQFCRKRCSNSILSLVSLSIRLLDLLLYRHTLYFSPPTAVSGNGSGNSSDTVEASVTLLICPCERYCSGVQCTRAKISPRLWGLMFHSALTHHHSSTISHARMLSTLTHR